jgi:Undecaprenyl-phosphate galactose phosphotransferase WbaP
LRTLREKNLGLRVAGVFTDGHLPYWSEDLPPVLGDLTYASRAASSRLADYAIVAMPNMSNLELRRMIEECCRGFRHVLLVPDLPGLCSIGICAREIGGEVGFEVPQRLFHQSAGALKRLIDVVVSGFILIALAPLFVLIAAVIKLTSAGPVLYSHVRHGRQGKTFKALKFRTMVANADRVLLEYLDKHPQYVLEWQRDHKLRDDPRVTRIGRWLRRFSLDELPQIFNVLAGQMSLVGPRPIVQAEIQKYGRGYGLYTRVLPGLTGLWQISGRNNTTYEERVAFDEYYVRNWSIWMDTYILLRTVSVVLTAEGAY